MTGSPYAVKKRRRPALSCSECRRRKVRCDRNRPCAQCIAHRTNLCTYDDARPGLQEHQRHEEANDGSNILNPLGTSQGTGADSGRTILEIHHPDNPAVPTEEQPNVAPDTSFPCPTPPADSGQVHGIVSKTRLFGPGHWMSTIPLLKGLPTLEPVSHSASPFCQSFRGVCYEPDCSIVEAVAQCKQLARDMKKQLPSRSPLPAGIHQSFPNRLVMKELIDLYFNTFESCYRILHLPSFRAEYECYTQQPETAHPSSVVKISLVMSIAAALHCDSTLRFDLRVKAQRWIHISHTWLSAPLEKDRLTIDGIQIHCLLLLARQVNRIGADLVWISSGSLIRMAMQMGLHQDPTRLGPMSLLEKELRRRLWYTILEINVQSALDSGMSASITVNEYTTQPPSDLGDDELEEVNQHKPPTKRVSYPTPTSFQCLLANSVPLRLVATTVINSLQEGPPYDQVLSLGSELASACRNVAALVDKHASLEDGPSPNEFRYGWCDHLHRRFLLCLHLPYAVQAKQSPLYSYSMKVCLEASQDLVSLLENNSYHRLLLIGGGMFRDIITRSALVIFLELVTQLEDDSSTYSKKRNRLRREPLIADARKVVRYAHDRMCYGETNVRCYLFTCMAMAQTEAMLDGRSTKDDILNAARSSLAVCHGILKSMAAGALSNKAIDSDLGAWTYNDMAPVPTAVNTDFDFLNDENMNFDFLDSCILQRWIDETLP
ncbi:putative C6 transcription factor [Aspergillus alliaceus]|uniref:putative C6 transcription factor n=1 Tax=Petromyces alliaceus TaxID=209559 RepID=UPI0012A62A65|nr:putative C6 transcription factor [Aspergillus alliaceus]KAB8229639.1 putative C6 transcription factor [Aspergillus alliaceus]